MKTQTTTFLKSILSLLVFIICLLGNNTLLKAQCAGTVTLDQSTSAAGGTSFTINTTFTNELIMISYDGWNGPGNGPITVDGNNATFINSAHVGNAGSAVVYAYAAPAAGTHTIVCNESGYNGGYFVNSAASFYSSNGLLNLSNITSSVENSGCSCYDASINTLYTNSAIYCAGEINSGVPNNNPINWTGATQLTFTHQGSGVDGSDAYVVESVPGTYTITGNNGNSYLGVSELVLVAIEVPGPIALVATDTTITCNRNGTIHATLTGGTAPFTYLWSTSQTTDTISGLSAGTYSVTITDANSCSSTATVNLSLTSSITATLTTNIQTYSCLSNGKVGVTMSGGSNPYTYSWSNGETTAIDTGLGVGTYTVTVFDNCGSTTTQSYSVADSGALSATVSLITGVTCASDNNGSLSVGASGGTAPYTYLWSNSQTDNIATGLTAGTYSVTVTDISGCSATASGSVSQTDFLNTDGNASFSFVSSADQSWVVPAGITQITVSATGASGGSSAFSVFGNFFGGKGATVTGVVSVTPGHTINILTGENGYPGHYGGGGGGGTYVWDSNTASLLVVAGGGGGSSNDRLSNSSNDENGGDGQSDMLNLNNPTTDPNNICAAGGSGGNGGTSSSDQYASAAGAGWNSDGEDASSRSGGFVIGGADPGNGGAGGGGGFFPEIGGFGGGGGGCVGGGGGGGYNGGGGGGFPNTGSGGGGGSFCSGTVISTSASNVGNGSVTISYPATPVVKNIDCTPGIITVPPASGGTPPYIYNWAPGGGTSNVDSVTIAGTYTLTVSDGNGCSVIDSATVTGTFTNLLANVTVTSNETCNGGSTGSALSSPTGGTSPYTYSWSDASTTTTASVSNLSAGTYTLTLTDNTGCSTTATATITEPTAVIAVAVTDVNVTCAGGNNGSASVSASGGISPYIYIWSNSQTTDTATALTAGTYSVTVMDNSGCSGTSTTTVAQTDFIAFAGNTSFSFVSSADQSWVVPAGITQITVTTTGGSGGNSSMINHPNATGGPGATITGVINVTPGHTIKIEVGGTGYPVFHGYGGSGGGGTFVWDSNSNSLLQVAGGGGGCNAIAFNTYNELDNGGPGQSDMLNLNNPTTDAFAICAAGGSGGNGGNVIPNSSQDFISGAGAGWLSDGATGVSGFGGTTTGGSDPANGGAGGSGGFTYIAPGGFGGGGGGNVAGGGGGGYNGGGGGSDLEGGGGGGGSFCSGTVTSTSATNIGNGLAIISYSAAPVVTNATCNPGSISIVAASGGTGPYTYNWTPSGGTDIVATGLSAGSYTITATDANGCSTSASATVTGITPLATTASVTSNVSCNGGSDGSAVANPSGGTTPYTYAWSDANTTATANISGLSYGTYTVSVSDSNGCNATASVTISQPAAFLYIVAGTVNNVTCNGGNNGSVTVNSVGGSLPYTYNWSNGATTQVASSLTAGSYFITVSDNCGASHTATANVSQPNAMRDSVASQTNIICGGGNGGSITIGAKGGSYPYRYLWSNAGTTATETGLSAGTYSVVITDLNGCTNTVSGITITQPTPINESLGSITYPICNGSKGSASVNVSGGTSPYQYIWAPSVTTTSSATSLAAGTYTVSVKDAHRCISTLTITITQPFQIRDTIVKTSIQNVSCNGQFDGRAGVGVKYGTSPYTYTWTPNVSTRAVASGLSAGTYSVTVTDINGCTSSTAVVTITQPLMALRDSVSLLVNVGCNGGSGGQASIGARGGSAPYTYLWSNGASTHSASGLSAGTYSVTVTDNHGCSFVTTGIVISQPANPVSASIGTNCIGNHQGTLTVTPSGGTPGYNYLWSNSKTTSSVTVANGTYSVKVSDSHGCNFTTSTIVACPGALKEDVESPAPAACCATIDNINLYPNPNNGQFTITGLTQGMMIEVYDYTGRKISTASASEISMQLNISTQPNGIYLIRILDKDGNLVSQKKVIKTN